MLDTIRKFLHLEAASAILLIIGMALAMVLVNSPAHGYYDALLGTRAAISLGEFSIDKPLLLWINDGLMALFFFLVGLEIKREVMEGELSSPAQIVLPAVAAIGGMAVPALFYVALNWATRWRCAAGRSRLPPTSPSPWACSACSGGACRSRSSSSCSPWRSSTTSAPS